MSNSTFEERVDQFKESILKNIHHCFHSKIKNLTYYLKDNNIKTVVLGVSGGIDSTVVLAMLQYVKEWHIPELNIIARCYLYSYEQDYFEIQHVKKLHRMYLAVDVDFQLINLDRVIGTVLYHLDENGVQDKEVTSNIGYTLRYTMLFSEAQASKGIVIGTTNLDEYGYAGWFGKHSDMKVDLLPIIDLHKFEVIEFAKILNLPKDIIERTPKGDLVDQSSDEDNFGCTYDQLSYLTYLMLNYPANEDVKNPVYDKVHELHKKHYHKYTGSIFGVNTL